MAHSINEKVPLLTLSTKKGRYVLVVHGGAGIMSRESSTPEREVMYKYTLSAALRAGYNVLTSGGEAMDAAVAAVTVLEGQDCTDLFPHSPCQHHQLRLPSVQLWQGCCIQRGR